MLKKPNQSYSKQKETDKNFNFDQKRGGIVSNTRINAHQIAPALPAAANEPAPFQFPFQRRARSLSIPKQTEI